jgi:hypothetical protein
MDVIVLFAKGIFSTFPKSKSFIIELIISAIMILSLLSILLITFLTNGNFCCKSLCNSASNADSLYKSKFFIFLNSHSLLLDAAL